MRRVSFPQSRGLFGVAQIDITPPVGIYHRMWGAASHDQATGVHRPLTATVLVVSPTNDTSDQQALVMIAIDHCLFWTDEMAEFLTVVSATSDVPPEQLRVFFSHTHAAGLMGHERVELPGGDLILEYLDATARKVGTAVRAAMDSRQLGTCVYGTGRCDLARNRDFLDENLGEYVCGFNPDGVADDTLLLARVTTDADEKTLVTLVNYACHPTTLAWDNTLISPDYLGAMREVVEGATDAPCFFIQGASGDIGPLNGFVGDVAVADRNGRQLGYAVLSGLEGLAPAGNDFAYSGPVVSGATIGTWQWSPVASDHARRREVFEIHQSVTELNYREDLPSREELEKEDAQWQQTEAEAREAGDDEKAQAARAMRERIRRRMTRVGRLNPDKPHPFPIWIWIFGDALWIALDGEHYNVLQTRLRESCPDTPIIIGTLTNGSQAWYLPDQDSYGKGLYQETASVLAKGALEKLIDSLQSQIHKLVSDDSE